MDRPDNQMPPLDEPAATERSADDAEHSLDDLVNEGDVVMLVTSSQGRLTSRPKTVAGLGAGTLLFLVDGTAEWVLALDPSAEVNASISTRWLTELPPQFKIQKL